MSGETVVLENGHLDSFPTEINLSLGNRQVEIRYERSSDRIRLALIRIEVSYSDLKVIAENLKLDVQAGEMELTASDGMLEYTAFTDKGRMFMAGVLHGS